MNKLDGIKRNADLRKHWREWTGIIELFARQKSARRHVDERSYEKLYRKLRAACCVPAAGEDECCYFHALEVFVKPWLSVLVLESTDSEILGSVFERCRQVDEDLNGRHHFDWIRSRKWQLLLTCLLVAAATAAAFTPVRQPAIEWFELFAAEIRRLVLQITLAQEIAAGAAIAVFVGACLIARVARTQ